MLFGLRCLPVTRKPDTSNSTLTFIRVRESELLEIVIPESKICISCLWPPTIRYRNNWNLYRVSDYVFYFCLGDASHECDYCKLEKHFMVIRICFNLKWYFDRLWWRSSLDKVFKKVVNIKYTKLYTSIGRLLQKIREHWFQEVRRHHILSTFFGRYSLAAYNITYLFFSNKLLNPGPSSTHI